MRTRKSGIARAIEFFGSQTVMAARLAAETGSPINQGYISKWLAAGHVPRKRASLVAQMTGVKVADLLRQTPRKQRAHGKTTPADQY